MSAKDTVKQLMQEPLGRLYLLHGDDLYWLRKAEQTLVEALLPPEDRQMNLLIFEQEVSVGELVRSVETAPFFGQRQVIVLRSGKGWQSKEKAEEEALLALLANIPEYACLLIVGADGVDKRRRWYKAVEKNGRIVEFSPLKAKDLRAWLQQALRERACTMTGDAQEWFLSIFGQMPQLSQELLENELDKVFLYVHPKKQANLEAATAVLGTLPETSVFAIMDAMNQRKAAKALELLQDQFRAGEHPLRFLGLLARQVRQLWQAKEYLQRGIGARELGPKLGVAPFIAEKMAVQSKGFSAKALRAAFQELSDADWALKSGRADAAVLEGIIIRLCRRV